MIIQTFNNKPLLPLHCGVPSLRGWNTIVDEYSYLLYLLVCVSSISWVTRRRHGSSSQKYALSWHDVCTFWARVAATRLTFNVKSNKSGLVIIIRTSLRYRCKSVKRIQWWHELAKFLFSIGMTHASWPKPRQHGWFRRLSVVPPTTPAHCHWFFPAQVARQVLIISRACDHVLFNLFHPKVPIKTTAAELLLYNHPTLPTPSPIP